MKRIIFVLMAALVMVINGAIAVHAYWTTSGTAAVKMGISEPGSITIVANKETETESMDGYTDGNVVSGNNDMTDTSVETSNSNANGGSGETNETDNSSGSSENETE